MGGDSSKVHSDEDDDDEEVNSKEDPVQSLGEEVPARERVAAGVPLLTGFWPDGVMELRLVPARGCGAFGGFDSQRRHVHREAPGIRDLREESRGCK